MKSTCPMRCQCENDQRELYSTCSCWHPIGLIGTCVGLIGNHIGLIRIHVWSAKLFGYQYVDINKFVSGLVHRDVPKWRDLCSHGI